MPVTWVCKKHGAVSHSSTEAEVIALDAALRLEGLPALMLWDTVIEVLSPKKVNQNKKSLALGDQSRESPEKIDQNKKSIALGDSSRGQPTQGFREGSPSLSGMAR